MRRIPSLFSFLFSCLLALDLLSNTLPQLPDNHTFTNPVIYSSDLIPLPKRFILLEIPNGIDQYKVLAKDIQKKFSAHGLDVALSPSGIVTFILEKRTVFPNLERQIASRYEQRYRSLDFQIQSIHISPSNNSDITGYQLVELNFHDNLLKRNNGSFSAVYEREGQQKKLFFRYEIEATLTVLRSLDTIYNDQLISPSSYKSERIAFDHLYHMPATPKQLQNMRTKKYISKNRIITAKDLELMPDIIEDSKIMAVYNESGIQLETEATALDDGYIGDTIRIKSNNKTFRATIIENGKVEIK